MTAEEKLKECPKCKGKGYLPEVMEMHGIPHINMIICEKCDGTGRHRPNS